MNDSRWVVSAHADDLRALAQHLAHHGVGDRWQGPARRHCEIQLAGLEDELVTVARRLEVASQYAGVHNVWADM
jgi:hypothetical protein